jgi:hypothetical protein
VFQNNKTIRFFDEFQHFTKASQGGRCFENCSSLKRITINSTGWRFEYMCVNGTRARWNIINARTDVLSYSSWGIRGIGNNGDSTMILRMNWVAALAASPQGKPKTYVPDELLDSYKTAANWSGIASYIHPISEYTGD